MSEEEFLYWLTMVMDHIDECDDAMGQGILDSFRTYEESMILTKNSGLVVKTRDGCEFQLTIVKSR